MIAGPTPGLGGDQPCGFEPGVRASSEALLESSRLKHTSGGPANSERRCQPSEVRSRTRLHQEPRRLDDSSKAGVAFAVVESRESIAMGHRRRFRHCWTRQAAATPHS